MPFDALVTTTVRQSIADLGIIPIPQDDLEVYKQAEAAKYPASILGSLCEDHIEGLQAAAGIALALFAITGIIGALGTVISFIAMLAGEASMSLFLGWLTVLVVGGGIAFATLDWIANGAPTPFRGDATWGESYYSSLRVAVAEKYIPTEILDVARDIQARFPAAGFVVGELKQNNVVLDPYLKAEIGGHYFVLGIWDDEHIIRVATRKVNHAL